MASTTLDLPQPFGPTIAVTPSEKSRTTLSRNDLKPDISNLFNFMITINAYDKILSNPSKRTFLCKEKYNKMYQ
jgi:hypothetical protein